MTIESFCARSYEDFNLDRIHSDYVDVLVSPYEGGLTSSEEGQENELVNPLIFLTGVRGPQNSAYALSRAAEARSIACVIGTYGLGKTELMHQTCHHLLQNRVHYSSPRPLPVNLALCNPRVGLLNGSVAPSGEEFADLLFAHLVRDTEERAFANGPLLSAIMRGEVFLILDGLDELAITFQQYRGFFEGLLNFIALGVKLDEKVTPLFRVVVSMRYEYLTAWAGEGGMELARMLRKSRPLGEAALPLYFLRLDLFDNSRVQTYMDRRLPDRWYGQVRKHRPLLEILYRPLLLRIFCDMAAGPEGDELFQELVHAPERYRNAAQLIDDYVKRAGRDPELKKDQKYIESVYQWEPDALARVCLDLYMQGINSMGVEDLRKTLQPDASEASAEDVWRGIHKCPFLRRNGKVVIFTHRSFLEFFVAKGVSLDMERSEREGSKFSAFDTLVLNVDTRKFLKSIVVEKESEEQWFRRTRHAYGLDDAGEWDPLYPQDLEALDQERRILLDAMTEPESKTVNERARGCLATFLERNHDHLHPRYLTYNYEAVAVFLKSNRGGDLHEVRKRFGDLLQKRLEKTMADLASLPAAKNVLRGPMELLVERILSIALRLRYPWVTEYEQEDQVQHLKDLIVDKKIESRIATILEDISKAIFVAVR